MNEKGVSSTLEYILIFGVFFIILTSSVLVVRQIEDRIISYSSRDKLEIIGEKIATKITEMYVTHLEGSGFFSKELGVPSQVNGDDYKIYLGNDSVILVQNDVSVTKKLFNLNKSIDFRGSGLSSDDLVLFYDGMNMTLKSSG